MKVLALAIGIAGVALFAPLTAGAQSTATVNAGAQAGDGAADTFTIALSGDSIKVTLNGAPVQSIPVAGLGALTVQGSSDDDTLTVDESGGLITLPGGIHYDGGAGFDSLAFRNPGGQPLATTSMTPGPGKGGGTIVHGDGTGTQTVVYDNLEPVTDTVASALLTISGTNIDDAIQYSQGSLTTRGLVSIDLFETYEFANKTNLVINAGAGNDTINLNDPTKPTGLSGTITVNGNDPVSNDTLFVNGLVGQLDNLRNLPTAVGSGVVVNDDAPQPNVIYTGIERLQAVVQTADGDGVRVDGTTGNDAFSYSQGATPDAGTFTGVMDQNNATTFGPFAMTPFSFSGASMLANDVDFNFFNPGGTDTLRFNGTNANDTLEVAGGEAGGDEFRDTVAGTLLCRLEAVNIASATVLGLGGDDAFSRTYGGPAAVTMSFQGGSGSGDVLDFTPLAGAATTADLGARSLSTTGPALAATTYSSMETVNVLSSGAGSTLAVKGSAGRDAFAYTPTDATGGTVTLPGSPVLNFSGVGANFSIDPLAGSNSLHILGSDDADTYNAQMNTPATVQVGAFKSVSLNPPSFSLLGLDSGGGFDTFNVTTFASTAANLKIDGGDPIGKKTGDALTVFTTSIPVKVLKLKGSAGSGQVDVTYTTGGNKTSTAYVGVEVIKVSKIELARWGAVSGTAPTQSGTVPSQDGQLRGQACAGYRRWCA